MRTTDSRHDLPIAPNLLGRNFFAAAPNRVWLADITYVATDQGWLYLATVLDLYSRRIVGWAMEDHLRADLPLAALRIAVSGQGIAICSDLLVAPELASGALVKLTNVTMPGCAFYVVHRASHPKMASIKAFVAWAMEAR